MLNFIGWVLIGLGLCLMATMMIVLVMWRFGYGQRCERCRLRKPLYHHVDGLFCSRCVQERVMSEDIGKYQPPSTNGR